MTLQYKVSRELGIVTVYPTIAAWPIYDREAFGVDLDESDLIAMLSALRTGNATLTELAGS
jgi:glutamine phosphoribosylpyrophosphate amidotransferase